MARQTADLNSVLPKKPSVSDRSRYASCSPGTTRMAASRPLAHSHDHYEERSMVSTECLPGLSTENKSTSGRGRRYAFRAAPFDNNGSPDTKALCAITPAAIGPQYFCESAEVINAASGGPPDRAKMAEIMRRHGLTPAPPSAQA